MPKLYEVWPGTNRFLCNCCITGPGRQIGGIIYVYICMLGIVIPFSIFVVKVTWQITPALPLLFYIILVFMQIFMFLTTCTDPGIIPRRPFLQSQAEKFKLYLNEQGRREVKLCDTCMIYRPQRASHCSSCQNCVQVFDHHCGIVGNCIGKRNYRYFVLFLAFTALAFIMAIINMAVFIVQQSQSNVNQTAVIVIVSVIGGVLGLPIIGFFLFHVFLTVTKFTTRQCCKNLQNMSINLDNQWCNVDEPLFDPFQEITQQQAYQLAMKIQNLRRPMVMLPNNQTNKTNKQIV